MLPATTDFQDGLLPALERIQSAIFLVLENSIFLKVHELLYDIIHGGIKLECVAKLHDGATAFGQLWWGFEIESLEGQKSIGPREFCLGICSGLMAPYLSAAKLRAGLAVAV
jgi:hypothetical protein